MYIYSQMITIPLGLGFLFYCPQVDFSGVTKFQNEGQLILLNLHHLSEPLAKALHHQAQLTTTTRREARCKSCKALSAEVKKSKMKQRLEGHFNC